MATSAGRGAAALLIGTVLAVAAVVALAAGVGLADDRTGAGASRQDAGVTQPPLAPIPQSTSPADAVPVAAPPQLAQLLEIADEVSADGRYVRIGDVEISAAPVVSRDG